MHQPLQKSDWIGRKVRIREELRQGPLVIPKGTILMVTSYRAGLALLGDLCDCCGTRAVIRGVPEQLVELLNLDQLHHNA